MARDGHDVVAADSFLSAGWQNLIDFAGDVLTLKDHDDVASMTALGKFDAIFHQASITGVIAADGSATSDPQRMLRNNVETFRGLLDWAADTKARVIWASSCSVYGRGTVPMKESQTPDPLNTYAFSKLCMERLAKRYEPKLAHPIVGLRYINVYGPGEPQGKTCEHDPPARDPDARRQAAANLFRRRAETRFRLHRRCGRSSTWPR